ncbi:DNA-processing protein DprA [Polynucleobacter sp. MWH-Berg-3C6]|uniref:DNA-processing protein DprA n=1 Tax=Polynucleobacter sp. MWH-Berg-3C6 TaxID=1855882 RepID=UPI001C0D2796|nr:DNA-processing protein DprA [Polynucleobacter sp. MWH-Berg-3C6]MBU3551200.1 DNA-protecting protein DprA [Polynucleobacter sp. MWH-Berg-3C6]
MPIFPKSNCTACIARGDKNYPNRLNDLYDPPSSLYIDGDLGLLKTPMIAIVGSRKASAEGLKNASAFAQELSRAGLLIVSGLARGIDGAAHQATLNLGPKHFTMAVCGAGLDVIYPKEHLDLARNIQNQGLLVSEYPLGTAPKSSNFPRRNRIIAAFSIGVLVIEAAERSGSLITARLALEMGREVFAVPGSIRQPLSRGCNLLIQQGAKLAQNPEDVLEELVF